MPLLKDLFSDKPNLCCSVYRQALDDFRLYRFVFCSTKPCCSIAKPHPAYPKFHTQYRGCTASTPVRYDFHHRSDLALFKMLYYAVLRPPPVFPGPYKRRQDNCAHQPIQGVSHHISVS